MASILRSMARRFAALIGGPAKPTFDWRFFADDQTKASSFGTYDFGSYKARISRHALMWAAYEGTLYSDVHDWSRDYRLKFGLNAHCRPIYNPTRRVVDFWVNHLAGGPLDPTAGDGQAVASAIPIVPADPAKPDVSPELRKAIARFWDDSNWQTGKDVVTRWGAALGEVGVLIDDDPSRRRVTGRAVHPSLFYEIDWDQAGVVEGYCLVERRPDPEAVLSDGATVQYATYKEVCDRVWDADLQDYRVRYTTYRDDLKYDWREYPPDTPAGEKYGPTWTVPYPFVPLVWIKHIDAGGPCGWAETYGALSKIREADDQASILHDQIRKAVSGPWLFNFAQPSAIASRPQNTPRSEFDAEGRPVKPQRHEQNYMYVDQTDARGQPLVTPLDIEGCTKALGMLLSELEAEFPELCADGETTGDSGRARRLSRQRAEQNVHARRATYDRAWVRVHKMAISIAAARRAELGDGYDDFAAFTPESEAKGELDHAIGPRPVFAHDPLDEIEEENARVTCLRTAKEAGVDVPSIMARLGYSTDEVEAARKAIQQQLDLQTKAADAQVEAAKAKAKATTATAASDGKTPRSTGSDPPPQTAARAPGPPGEGN